MKQALLILMILIGGMGTAYASAPEPVMSNQLELIGRGVMDRKTGESIALTCTQKVQKNNDPGVQYCSEMRFVYFSNDGKAYLMGNPIVVPDAPTLKLEEKTKSLLINEYLQRHQTSLSRSRSGQYMKLVSLGGLGTIGYIALASVSVSFGGVALLVVALPATMSLLLTDRLITAMAVGVKTQASVTDQDQWNWSVEPKRISHGRFKAIYSQVTLENPTDTEIIHSISAKKRRLYTKGVKGIL